MQRVVSREFDGVLHPDNVNRNDKSKLFLNNLSSEEEDRTKLTAHLISYLQEDFEAIQSCQCGNLKKKLTLQIDEKCIYCNTTPMLRADRDLEPTLYLDRPVGIVKLMLPNVWGMFANLFMVRSFNLLLHLCDTNSTEKVPDNIKAELAGFKYKRGYNYFINNLGYMLYNLSQFKHVRVKEEAKNIMPFYDRYKEDFLVDKLYMMNKQLVPIEESSTGKYFHHMFTAEQDAARGVDGIDVQNLSVAAKCNRVARFTNAMSGFYQEYMAKMFEGKKGVWKKHVFNTRGVYIIRAVTISKAGIHDLNKIDIPWTLGVVSLEQFITSKMIRDHYYTMNEAKTKFNKCIHNYCPFIHKLVKEIIAETPDERFYVMVQRFPTLTQESFVRSWFNGIGTNPQVHAIGYSDLALRGMNLDFDGDNLHVSILWDTLSVDSWSNYEYHNTILSKMEHRKMSSNLALTVQTVINYSGWKDTSPINECVDEDKIEEMELEFA